uniref:Capsid n=1 Tax=Porcine parvovirus 4 TaxID=707546 RepID=I6TK69_9VIRU|nr:capsid [Porcine parvovirus 4]
MQKHGHWPHLWAPFVDRQMSQEIQQVLKGSTKLSQKLLANFIIALWRAKEKIGAPIYEIVKGVFPSVDKKTVESLLPHPDPIPAPPSSPQRGSKRASPPQSPNAHDEDTMSGHKRQKTMEVESECDKSLLCPTQNAGADFELCGTGGGATNEKGTWVGGTQFTDTSIRTFGTRRCVLSAFPDTYCSMMSGDAIPSIIFNTPWYYYDLNIMSCHFSPSAFQTLIEDYDAFRPRSLTVHLKELVIKDVCQQQGLQAEQVSDNNSATLLAFEDVNYELPYVLGGGQVSVPGHLPGQPYQLPKYSYRTVGKPDPNSGFVPGRNTHPDQGPGHPKASKTIWYSQYLETQDTEFYILENHKATILHSGNTFSQNYNFPDLPFEQLTQYMWDARRQDNPLIDQRIQVMSRMYDDGPQKTFAIKVNPYIVPFTVKSTSRPAMFLAGGRFKDGDYSITGPGDRQKTSFRYYNDPPWIITRDTYLFSSDLAKTEREQPGPRQGDTVVRTPDGTLIVTTNALAYGYTTEYLKNIPLLSSKYHGVENFRLAVENERGYSMPGHPSHIRETLFRGKLPSEIRESTIKSEDQRKEITFPDYMGSVNEKTTANLESQIWSQIPNTDITEKCTTPPLSIWGMKNPPPMVFLRLLAQMGPPRRSACSGSIPSNTYLNQYCQFLLTYEMEWDVIKRTRKTVRWNPIPPPQIPMGPNNLPVYILNKEGQYRMPTEVWTAKQRPRHRR